MKLIKEVKDLKDKRVLLRVDFDVPVDEGGNITEPFRVIKQKNQIEYLVDKGARVVMVGHNNYIASFEPIVEHIEKLLDFNIKFISDYKEIADNNLDSSLWLLDNIRKWPGEKENSHDFAKDLARGFDFYINNAFAEVHRSYASVDAITSHLPGYAGNLIEEEVESLSRAINAPAAGKIIIMGGAKTSTKIPVIKNFIEKAEKIIIGGVTANDVLTVRGYTLHASNVDPNSAELLSELDINDRRLVLPIDFKYSPDNDKIWDIGPKSIELFLKALSGAKMIIWNGPVGFFEKEGYENGTFSLAKAIAVSDAFKIIGGGDTISAVDRASVLDRFDFISTGGGAMLAFLAGQRLPGLKALGYYEQ